MRIVEIKRSLKIIFLVCLVPTGIVLADTFTGTDISIESELNGGTVIDFSNGSNGTSGTSFQTYTEGDVTFSNEGGINDNNGSINIDDTKSGFYNTTGFYLQNTTDDVGVRFTNPSKSLKFVFTNPVSAFGFNLGHNLNSWDLKAYDSSDTLLETYNLPTLLTTDNNGEYFGISSDSNNISYATLIDRLDTHSGGNWIFIDNFTYLILFRNEWLQPFAAMQNVGLTSIKNNKDLVLAKAGECNDYGWVIDETDFCLYSTTSNSISNVNGNSNYGGYDYANFNTSLIIEKTFNEEWKAGISYGVGSSNLDNFNFSGTTANFHSTNTHYSIYGFKQVSKKFSLKGLIGVSDFDYAGNRNYLNKTAESTYDADGYTVEIVGVWDFNKFIKESNTLINVKPSIGMAFAAHNQDGFSESGSGHLVTIKSNRAESLLLKTGLKVENQILMEGGKWILIPSFNLNYEFDALASSNNRKISGFLQGSTDETTFVSSKTLGEHNVSANVGADFICTENLSFNLNAKYVLTDGGNQHSFGGGFRFVF